jgi:non-ribosomal peptide synthase protein (TIGR01720 family)
LCREQVTVLNQTPSAFHQLVQREESPGTASELALRLVIFGGEALEFRSLRPWFDRHGDRHPQLVNMYGITETTVHVTYRSLSIADLSKSLGSIIGVPIPDLQVYVLDQHLQPAPIGVPGEMYVGGAGLARGYLNHPGLTAERFIPDPFGGKLGSRLYKTGDLARYLPNRDIEYLGRSDQQVKIRGFRIEPGEIEAVLGQHPSIRESVVIAREDTPGDKRLTAYLIPASGLAPTAGELRSFLKERLPGYMVPAAFVLLDRLPLTPSGKVDRRALPAPDQTRPELEKAFVAPRNASEEALTKIWVEVLRLEKVGIHDNFFELGGDSILSIQIVARANRSGLRLTPKQVFQYQTIAELAGVADTTPTIEAEQGAVTGPVPFTPIQHWFFEQNLPEPHHWNQSVLLEVLQRLDLDLLQGALDHLLVHHDALRLRLVRTGSDWRQVNAGVGKCLVLSRVDLSTLPEEEQMLALEREAVSLQASLNLSDGPLMRVVFFDLGARNSGCLLLVIHHLAVDGVSWRVLLEDLEAAYQRLNRREPVKLPAKTTSFKQWAERLIDKAQSGRLDEELDYWLAEPRSLAPRLPVDHPAGDNIEASARTVSAALSVEETMALLHDVPKVYHTQINDALLTALVLAFARWTKVCSLLVDLEGHGREPIFEDIDLSRTVGWFTTIYPVLLDLGENVHPGNALKSVKEQLRRIPNRGIGYGLLRYLGRDKSIAEKLRKLPQPEVSFNYLGQFDPVLTRSSLFAWAKQSTGPAHSLKGTRRHLLNINGNITRGQLQLNWTYSENIHRAGTVENLAHGFVESLRSLITHCQSPDAGGYTPSDFPLAKLKQQHLDKIIAKFSKA